MNSVERTNFRKRKIWLDFRESFRKEKDALTGSKLSKRFNLHHLDMNPQHYDDLSHRENFVPLNSKSHDLIHFLLSYYKKDPAVLDRLKDLLDRMVELDNVRPENPFKVETPEDNLEIKKRIIEKRKK